MSMGNAGENKQLVVFIYDVLLNSDATLEKKRVKTACDMCNCRIEMHKILWSLHEIRNVYVCLCLCLWVCKCINAFGNVTEHALNGFFLIVDKHRGEHNLAEAFNAPGHTIVDSRFVFPCNTNIKKWDPSYGN